MAARRKQKRSISSLISAIECCRKAGREAVLKMVPCALLVSGASATTWGPVLPKELAASSELEKLPVVYLSLHSLGPACKGWLKKNNDPNGTAWCGLETSAQGPEVGLSRLTLANAVIGNGRNHVGKYLVMYLLTLEPEESHCWDLCKTEFSFLTPLPPGIVQKLWFQVTGISYCSLRARVPYPLGSFCCNCCSVADLQKYLSLMYICSTLVVTEDSP